MERDVFEAGGVINHGWGLKTLCQVLGIERDGFHDQVAMTSIYAYKFKQKVT